MIVTPIDKGWEIYFHKAHALLAMDIGLNLRRDHWAIPKYYAAGIESIGEHDNNQPKWNKMDNLTGTGAPLDYRQRKEVDLDQAKSVIRSVKYKSSFMVLMVLAHFHKLYAESKDFDVRKFLEHLGRSKDEIITHLGLQPRSVAKCYEFLRFCDDLSLALCQNDFENQKDPLEIDPIYGEEKVLLSQLPDGTFHLDPWLFDNKEKVFFTEYYTTAKDFYKEDEELGNDIDLLHPKEKKFVFKAGTDQDYNLLD
ncbi:DUF3891 family protein [Algoriphagus sp. AGSA1]|uniref:DUF3891 family protein n=1 Tax=Algoriphagus sp. AGSA1 TaxID=2907213 RepID=UPI001F197E40|nr:DUF3891 family protein [Algoriphagus sp. AGSA1]MCE7053602.1 DUF3891 family protein [Algoriphagus sp. AGSA1]